MKKLFSFLLAVSAGSFLYSQQVFTTFQSASMVIGQPNFTTNIDNTSDSITFGPVYCAISSKGMLAVAEQFGESVKIWHSLPARNGQPADITIELPGSSSGVDWTPDGNRLIAAFGSGLIYIWDTIPTVDNQPANVIISNYSGYPCGVLTTPDGKLLVSELYNNRILVWNSIPTMNNTPADYVIGQLDMVTTSSGNASGKLNHPWGLDLSPDGKLLIGDQFNNRIVIYDSVPETFGDTATVVIGQTVFGISTSGCSDSTLFWPVGVTVTVDGKVAVSEFWNNRITIWDSVPVSNNEKATVVLGQPDFVTNTGYYHPSGSVSRPYTISSDLNGRLFLCVRDMNRVMVFGELPSDSADLEISISGRSGTLCDSSSISYLIKIKNTGLDTAMNVVSTTAFPIGFKLNGFNAVNGKYTKASGYWEIPSIAPVDSALLYFEGITDTSKVDSIITMYANIINSSAFDTNLSNNGSSISLHISDSAKPANPTTTDVITCKGSQAVLNAEGSGTMKWYAGLYDNEPVFTGPTYTTESLTNPTTYYVEAFNNCASQNRVPVQVEINPPYNETATATICNGEEYIFGSQTLTVSGTYSETFSSFLGCDSTIVLTLTVNTVNSGVTQDGSVLTANATEGNFKWVNCSDYSVISGETAQSYSNAISGNYAVIISQNSCSDTSACFTIGKSNSINTEIDNEMSVYPNPAGDMVTIDLGQVINETSVTILNLSGQNVFKASYVNKGQITVDLSKLHAGIYIIRINSSDKTSNIRLIKQ